MTTGSSGREQSANPQRRVCVACPACKQGYRISARLIGRRLICRHCQHEWRAQEVDPAEFRSGRLTGDDRVPDSGTIALPNDLPPTAGSSSVAIDMSWAGRELGRYRVLSLLGQGGMGSVWRSHDATLRRDVALKILNRARRNGGEGNLNSELFLQEARAVAKLQHPSVVSIYEVVEDQGQIFLALELMEGGTLKEYVERFGRVPPRELFRMMIGPTRALGVAHKRGIIHRDVKPGNLMFDDHGNLKLMDFGLAEVAQEVASEKMRGKAVGSLGWIAPETARGLGTTAASDTYGMGLVMLYALTGKSFFQSKSRSELIAMHQNPPPLDLSGIKGLTPKGAAVLRRCLMVEQADRFLTADLLADAIEDCADEDPTLKKEIQKTVAKWVVALSVVITLLVCCAAFWIYTLRMDQQKRYMEPSRGAPRMAPFVYQEKTPPSPSAESPGGPTTPSQTPATQPAAGVAVPGTPSSPQPTPPTAATPADQPRPPNPSPPQDAPRRN
jgi:serine/threonine-protein kinase